MLQEKPKPRVSTLGDILDTILFSHMDNFFSDATFSWRSVSLVRLDWHDTGFNARHFVMNFLPMWPRLSELF